MKRVFFPYILHSSEYKCTRLLTKSPRLTFRPNTVLNLWTPIRDRFQFSALTWRHGFSKYGHPHRSKHEADDKVSWRTQAAVAQTSSTQTTLCHTHMSLNVILESRRVAMRTISLQKPLLGPPRNQGRHGTAGITRRRVACMLAPRSIWCRCDDYNCSLQCVSVCVATTFVSWQIPWTTATPIAAVWASGAAVASWNASSYTRNSIPSHEVCNENCTYIIYSDKMTWTGRCQGAIEK